MLPRAHLYGAIAAGVLSYPVNTFAQTSCAIRVLPPDADGRWQAVAREAAAQIAGLPASTTDCREIVMDVRGGEASVSIVTMDGRVATRPLRSPADAAPVIRALVVTVPLAEGSGQAGAAPTAATAPNTATPTLAPREPQPTSPPNPAAPGRFIFVAGGGARLGFADWTGASPEAILWLGALAGPFELGALATIDFSYGYVGATSPQSFHLSATSGGIFAGIRPTVGPLRLSVGFDAAAAFVEEQVADQAAVMLNFNLASDVVVSYRPIEALTGVYLAAVIPLLPRLRLRPQVALDVVAGRFGPAAPAGSSLPALPVWYGTFVVALEGVPL